MMTKYNDDSIVSLDDIAHMRLRTSAYIPDTGVAGLFTLDRELIDNGGDELDLLGKGCINIIMFIDEHQKSYQTVVMDNGRGIPRNRLIKSFSSAKTSGKFTTDAYKFSSGTFGVGGTVVCALSSWFRAITLNKDMIGDVTIPHNNIPTQITTVENNLGRTGTIVMFEPDNTIFTGIEDFINDYSRLLEYLIHLSLFSKYQIRFTVVNRSIPKKNRVMQTLDLISYFDNIIQNVLPEYDSATLNREQYVRSYFNIQRNWHGCYPIHGVNADDTLRVNGEICVLTSSTLTGQNTKLTFVNNLLFNDNNSLHITLLHRYIKNQLVNYIIDKNIKAFFVDHYKLPIWLVLDIKFSGAQFSGFAKTSFRDVNFRSPYQQLLKEMLPVEVLADMYRLMTEHLEIAYNKFSNSDFKPGTARNLLSRLNRPEKFNNCSTNDREAAELFLVEGDSAKCDQDRDSTFQASYTLGGKPFNGITDFKHLSESANNIKKNAIFQDIIRILNIIPGSDDLSGLNFWKTFIMADADTHGYHITNIVIGNLYAICPRLIEEGHVYITFPPLYSLNMKGADPIYIRNATELNATLAYHVYYQCIGITIESDRYRKELTQEEFVAFSEIIIRIGDAIDSLSNEYLIPSVLLEQLSLATNYINLNNLNIHALREMLGCDVRYIESSQLLIISMGSDDITIPLKQITELIYTRILPLYREFYYGKTRLYVTTKKSSELNEAPMMITHINEIFKRLNNMFTTERYKGLGSMTPVDRRKNCTAPATRRVYRLSSIGDVDTIFDMLGTDSSARKQLVLS